MNNKHTILYVDDELMNLQLFELNFSNKYHIITAESGQMGLDQLKKYPDTKVVISDMRMPEMNGIEFINLARKDFPDISYYILTGFEVNEEITRAMEQNVINKFLRKPFNKVEIEQAIDESLS